MRPPRTISARRVTPLIVLVGSIVLVWLLVSQLLVPVLIKNAYQGNASPWLKKQLPGRASWPLEHYQEKWNRVAWALLPVLIIAPVVALSRPGRRPLALLLAVLVVATEIRLVSVYNRAIWDDEAVTLLETAGHALPSWPRAPSPGEAAKPFYRGSPPLGSIVEDLRRTDIHPPVYSVLLACWRRLTGFSIESARMFSVVCSLASIIGLYLLLRAGRAERPHVSLLVYLLSTGGGFFGALARNYAFATLLIVAAALAAFLAAQRVERSRAGTALALVAATVCGVAFQTNYLTLFPAGVIVIWLSAQLWPRRRSLAIAIPLLALAIGSIGWPVLLHQLGAREDQAAGFIGWPLEILTLVRANAELLWRPMLANRAVSRGAVLLLIVLVLASLYGLARGWRTVDRGFWVLILGLAFAPSVGVALLDFIFVKSLAYSVQYVGMAGPFLAVVASRVIAVGIDSRRRLAALGLFGLVFLFEMNGTNWGYEDGPIPTSRLRSLARLIRERASPGQIVLVDQGSAHGRTNPGSLLYELDPTTLFSCYPLGDQAEQAWTTVQPFSDVWVVLSIETPMADQRRFLKRFRSSGAYGDAERHGEMVYRFRRIAPGG
ncbi:MAG: glycosyltransferase family 39 protein [Thermoanaerobaculia bacterium]